MMMTQGFKSGGGLAKKSMAAPITPTTTQNYERDDFIRDDESLLKNSE